MRVLVLNGPNLDRLGLRQPEVYGHATLSDLEEQISAAGDALGVETETVQSNHEGALIDRINSADHDGIVINPGALAHTSRALADSLRSVAMPAVEVHISNIREREPWRADSVVAESCVRSVYGRGPRGYADAIRHLVNRAASPGQPVRYGPHPDQIGDLRRGEGGLVVLVHGGFWRQEWERDTMDTLAVHLAGSGYHTWNIEYRRIGAGGGWPASAHDVLMALDFTPQLGLVRNRPISVVGHSAGGQLAMWAVSRTTTNVGRFVALAPVVDLDRHAGSGLFGDAEARALLDSGAPRRVDPGEVATTLVHGKNDDMVPIDHSQGLDGPKSIEVIILETGHFELLDPARGWSEALSDRLAPPPLK
ncbi:MAG: type II 3-dehydroquinate dehydratase [Acidimicrobiia bacterium]